MKWHEIAPEDAVGIDCTERPDLDPPVNENGDPCPWPWEPRQLTNVPMGMYHCSYCGAMCIAGLEHPDYRIRIVTWECPACEYEWQGPDDGPQQCIECGQDGIH